jgi:hypothetical protein
MGYGLLGFFAIAFLSLAAGAALAGSTRNPFPRRLVMTAVALRIVGSIARFDMIRLFYGGLADANRYFHEGLTLAKRIWAFDPWVFTAEFWFGGMGRSWGTPFMEKITGVVLTLVGPTMRGAYLVFSMMAFAGLYLIALAVYRHRPGPGAIRFATWVWLWPSLWFWPSSIGKEAVTVFAMGLVTYGYAGDGNRIHWLPLLAGLGLAFGLRPHVGAVLGLALAGAYWLQTWSRPSPRKIVEMVLAAALAVVLLNGMAAQFGLEDPDLEGVQEFVAFRGGQTLTGGSNLGARPSGLLALPMAFVNIWMRPFPWDVHNVMALFAAVEVLLLWWLAWKQRKWLRVALKGWWRDRMLAFAAPLLFGYTVMIGLTFANLGIIARQRSPLFPFLFILLTAAGAQRVAERRAARVPVLPTRGSLRASPGPPPSRADRPPPGPARPEEGAGVRG